MIGGYNTVLISDWSQDEDPCLVSNMTESILPLIPDRNSSSSHNNNNKLQSVAGGGTQVRY